MYPSPPPNSLDEFIPNHNPPTDNPSISDLDNINGQYPYAECVNLSSSNVNSDYDVAFDPSLPDQLAWNQPQDMYPPFVPFQNDVTGLNNSQFVGYDVATNSNLPAFPEIGTYFPVVDEDRTGFLLPRGAPFQLTEMSQMAYDLAAPDGKMSWVEDLFALPLDPALFDLYVPHTPPPGSDIPTQPTNGNIQTTYTQEPDILADPHHYADELDSEPLTNGGLGAVQVAAGGELDQQQDNVNLSASQTKPEEKWTPRWKKDDPVYQEAARLRKNERARQRRALKKEGQATATDGSAKKERTPEHEESLRLRRIRDQAKRDRERKEKAEAAKSKLTKAAGYTAPVTRATAKARADLRKEALPGNQTVTTAGTTTPTFDEKFMMQQPLVQHSPLTSAVNEAVTKTHPVTSQEPSSRVKRTRKRKLSQEVRDRREVLGGPLLQLNDELRKAREIREALEAELASAQALTRQLTQNESLAGVNANNATSNPSKIEPDAGSVIADIVDKGRTPGERQ